MLLQLSSDLPAVKAVCSPAGFINPVTSLSSFCRVDVVYHPWKKEEAGDQTREIMYTISLSNPLAPKTSTASETQVQKFFSLFVPLWV